MEVAFEPGSKNSGTDIDSDQPKSPTSKSPADCGLSRELSKPVPEPVKSPTCGMAAGIASGPLKGLLWCAIKRDESLGGEDMNKFSMGWKGDDGSKPSNTGSMLMDDELSWPW